MTSMSKHIEFVVSLKNKDIFFSRSGNGVFHRFLNVKIMISSCLNMGRPTGIYSFLNIFKVYCREPAFNNNLTLSPSPISRAGFCSKFWCLAGSGLSALEVRKMRVASRDTYQDMYWVVGDTRRATEHETGPQSQSAVLPFLLLSHSHSRPPDLLFGFSYGRFNYV